MGGVVTRPARKITTRMAEVDHHTWAPPLASEPQLPQKDDKANYSKEMNVPVEAMIYSDFIINGRWGGVDDALRTVYEEASEAVGREFPYPGD